MNRDALRAIWIEKSATVDSTFAKAACEYADNVANCLLNGHDAEVYRVQFDCAVVTRNRMMDAVAASLLKDVSPDVKATDAYMQYNEGLIAASECCNYLATH